MVKLKIDNNEEWLNLYWELVTAGLLGEVNIHDVVTLPSSAFPIEVQLDIQPLLNLLKNPMVKPFKKKINDSLTNYVLNVITEVAR